MFTTSAALPAYKGSTLRGGLGDVLLNEHCIQDMECKNCTFHAACVVPNIYYHPLKIVPDSVHDGGSLGFTIECPDQRTYAHAGDRMEFSILLYGDVIVHFATILDAVYRLGLIGIGFKKQARFDILAVRDQDRNRILEGGTVNPRAIRIHDLMADARAAAGRFLAQERSLADTPEMGHTLTIHFLSPWSQKWKNTFLTQFEIQAFADSVYRRVYLMFCMEGIAFPDHYDFDLTRTQAITLWQENKATTRYSNRQDTHIRLRGIQGDYQLIHVPEDLLPYIFAGEIVHIGKNTSIGFGQYKVGIL